MPPLPGPLFVTQRPQMPNMNSFLYFCEWRYFIPSGAFHANKNDAKTGLSFATPLPYQHGLERT
jgi:hypothetical protein